jgi:hypothetical protein
MKKPRKPKLRKLPKKPKQSSGIEVWSRYDDRVKDVQKENNSRIAEYNKKYRAWEGNRKRKDSIRKRAHQRATVKFAG